MANSVKISDVASSAGVSTATVSYVINGKAEGLGITLATRERAPAEPEPVVVSTPEPDLPNSSCPSCPSMLKPSGDTEEADSNIDRQDVQDRISVSDPTPEPEPLPGSSSDGLPADLPAGVPEAEVPEMATSPSTVAPESVPMDIEVADQVPETPHLNPLPQGERTENESTPQPPPVVSQVEPPMVPAPEPIAAVIPEPSPPAPIPEPEPVSVIFPTTEPFDAAGSTGLTTGQGRQPDNPTTERDSAGNSTTVLSPEPVPVDIEVATQILETPHPDPLPQGARENIIFQGEPDGTPPSTTAPEQESPLTNQ